MRNNPSKPIIVRVEDIAQSLTDEFIIANTSAPHAGHPCPETMADSLGVTGPHAAEHLARLTCAVSELSIDVVGDPPAVLDTLRRVIYANKSHDTETLEFVYMLITVAAGARNYQRTRPADLIGDEVKNMRAIVQRESARLFTDPALARAVACIAANTVAQLTRAFSDRAAWHTLRVSTAADRTAHSPIHAPDVT